jgi:hypothetical protein
LPAYHQVDAARPCGPAREFEKLKNLPAETVRVFVKILSKHWDAKTLAFWREALGGLAVGFSSDFEILV